MPKTHVEKSITIAAPAEKVKEIITDFSHWKYWSPWLILEPDAKVKVSSDGKKQEWDGSRIGAGEMTVRAEKDREINYDLTFLKPWKSRAKADFIISPEGDKTTLTWTMDGSLPFFMFFMKNMMERLVGMDYDRGLLMLKDYIEKGRVDVKLEFRGESRYPGSRYVGIKNKCTMDTIGEVMATDWEKLMEFAKKNRDLVTDEFFSIYHKLDFNKNSVVYTSGIGVKENVHNLPAELVCDNLPATKLYTVRHVGPYELSGNAWSAIMAMDRAKEFKKDKKVPPMEFYRNSPTETDPKELISDICMAVK